MPLYNLTVSATIEADGPNEARAIVEDALDAHLGGQYEIEGEIDEV